MCAVSLRIDSQDKSSLLEALSDGKALTSIGNASTSTSVAHQSGQDELNEPSTNVQHQSTKRERMNKFLPSKSFRFASTEAAMLAFSRPLSGAGGNPTNGHTFQNCWGRHTAESDMNRASPFSLSTHTAHVKGNGTALNGSYGNIVDNGQSMNGSGSVERTAKGGATTPMSAVATEDASIGQVDNETLPNSSSNAAEAIGSRDRKTRRSAAGEPDDELGQSNKKKRRKKSVNTTEETRELEGSSAESSGVPAVANRSPDRTGLPSCLDGISSTQRETSQIPTDTEESAARGIQAKLQAPMGAEAGGGQSSLGTSRHQHQSSTSSGAPVDKDVPDSGNSFHQTHGEYFCSPDEALRRAFVGTGLSSILNIDAQVSHPCVCHKFLAFA